MTFISLAVGIWSAVCAIALGLWVARIVVLRRHKRDGVDMRKTRWQRVVARIRKDRRAARLPAWKRRALDAETDHMRPPREKQAAMLAQGHRAATGAQRPANE